MCGRVSKAIELPIQTTQLSITDASRAFVSIVRFICLARSSKTRGSSVQNPFPTPKRDVYEGSPLGFETQPLCPSRKSNNNCVCAARHINANTHNQPKRAATHNVRLHDVDNHYISLLSKRERLQYVSVVCDDRCSHGLELQPPPDTHTHSHYPATFTKQSAANLTHIPLALAHLSVCVRRSARM